MMRSLWAGVTGLQAHQIAMDVEGNNIANVNTIGFKYSRANFSDLLSQTAKIATAPQGELGGKNPMQIGLGTQISSVTKIFKQGSIETTDKNTDLAIQGDGFFVVSPDGGSTYKYTRNGDFAFDAQGNFTEGNGYIIQGWIKDDKTGQIDATAPIRNITIPPGLTTPANDTGYITLKANLASGDTITTKSPIYSLDQYHNWVDINGDGIMDSALEENHEENGDITNSIFNVDREVYERGEDFASLFNANGEAFSLDEGQGVWISYADAKYVSTTVPSTSPIYLDIELNGILIQSPSAYTSSGTPSEIYESNLNYIQALINQHTQETGVQASVVSGGITLKNTNQNGTEESTKNIRLKANATDTSDLLGLDTSVDVITAFQYTYAKSPSSANDRADARTFRTTEDLRNLMQTDARLNTDYSGNGHDTPTERELNKNDGVTITINESGQFQILNPDGDAFNEEDGDIITALDSAGNPWTLTSAGLIFPGGATVASALGTEDLAGSILTNVTIPAAGYTVPVGATYVVAGVTTVSTGIPANTLAGGTVISYLDLSTIASPSNLPATTSYTQNGGATGGVLTESTSFPGSSTVVLDGSGDTLVLSADTIIPSGSTLNGTLLLAAQTVPAGTAITGLVLEEALTIPAGSVFSNSSTVVLQGTNTKVPNNHSMYISATALSDSSKAEPVNENTRFATTIKTLQGSLPIGNNIRTSQGIYAASHASSIDVYDSLGSKHTVRFEFRKNSVDDVKSVWDMIISAPITAEISDTYPYNILKGSISFGSDGSLIGYDPQSLRFTANNGSTPNQTIALEFGTAGQFDGMTSFDSESNTSGISQDGYPGGDLAGIRVDETGTLIGSFTNGRSFGLAQVAMAKFTNNEGLESDGGNTFIQTSNSGDPIIGQAAVGGRGFIQASSLEMSNVDLSRSLTQLIVIQRGYQANSKTITTADQMLQTLLQLKQ